MTANTANTKITGHNAIVILVIVIAQLFSQYAIAKEKIVILDFELNDITSLPNTKDELARTASFRPLLEQAISKKHRVSNRPFRSQRAKIG